MMFGWNYCGGHQSIPPERLIGVVIHCVTDSFLTKPLGHRYYHYQDQES